MKRKGFLIFGMVLTLLCTLGASAPVTSKGSGQKGITSEGPVTKTIRSPLPDLIVERIWLDNQGYINFSLKNAGKGRIPDREHLLGVVRVKWGRDQEDFFFERRSSRKKPPVDPKGVLKAPGGKVRYNTKIRLASSVKVSVLVDSAEKIAEANEKNNSRVANLTPLRVTALKERELPPSSLITPSGPKGLKPLGGGGEDRVWLSIESIYPDASVTPTTEVEIVYRVHNDSDSVQAVQVGLWLPEDSGGIWREDGVRVADAHGSCLGRVRFPAPERPGEYQAELRAFPYDFRTPLNERDPEDCLDYLTFDINVILPINSSLVGVARSIPPIAVLTLESEPALTGSIGDDGEVTEDLKVRSVKPKTRGFISFDLTPIKEKIDQWRREGWSRFEVRSAILDIAVEAFARDPTKDTWKEKRNYKDYVLYSACALLNTPRQLTTEEAEEAYDDIGDILLDLLDYGDMLTSSDYDAPMITNIRAFRCSCGEHSIPYLEAYVRYQLQRHKNRIQFRLRLEREGDKIHGAWFGVYFNRESVRLVVHVSAKRR